MEFLGSMDTAIFHFLAGNAQTPWLWAMFGAFCAKILIYIIPAHLLLLWFCGGLAERRAAMAVLLSVIIALLISGLIGIVFPRPRPFMAGLGPSLIQHKNNASFPSNHALIFAAYIYALYLYRYKRATRIALVAGALTCWARIFTGVHYPFDIVGGIVLGGASTWVVCHFIMTYVPNLLYQIPPLRQQNIQK